MPAAYTVLTAADLIADITAANTAGGANTITLAAPTTSPYALTVANNVVGFHGTANGLPVIAANDNLTIVGNGDTIERTAAPSVPFRLLDVAPLASLTLQNLTLQGGLSGAGAGGASGGAIYNAGALTLSGVIVANNEAEGTSAGQAGTGGGIWSNGSLTLENGTLVEDNYAQGAAAVQGYPYGEPPGSALGEAVYVAGGTANITQTTFTGNSRFATEGPGESYGGALYVVGGTVTLANDTVESNLADYGGAVYVAGGTVALTTDTMKSNSALYGGALYVAGGTVTLTNATVQSSYAEYDGGGIYIVSGATAYLDALTVANTINNTDGSGLNGSTANIDGPYILTPAAGQPPIVAHAASANPSPVTGTTTSLSVLGADASGPASLTYTWAVTSAPAGAATPTFSNNGSNASQNTTATFHLAGTYTFQVTITDPSGLTAVSSVTVTVAQTVTSLSLTPATVTLADGASQQFKATALDQFGQALAAQPTFTWQVSNSSGGTISSSGLYTAPKKGKGTFQVEVSADGLNVEANVTVT